MHRTRHRMPACEALVDLKSPACSKFHTERQGPIMANPFPGMDPYLESDLWMSVHTAPLRRDRPASSRQRFAPNMLC